METWWRNKCTSEAYDCDKRTKSRRVKKSTEANEFLRGDIVAWQSSRCLNDSSQFCSFRTNLIYFSILHETTENI